jgi:glycine cleavage system H protein
VGLDDFGQRLLPSVTAIEVNAVGSRVKRGEPLAVLHAGLLSVRIPSPVDGTVLAVNNGAKNDPGRVKSEPARTWLLKLAPSEPSYLRFPCGEATRTWLRAEEARLARFWEGELGLGAADGGGPLPQSVGRTGEDELAFARLAGAFLEA